MVEAAGMAECPSSGQSEVQLLLVHDAEAVYTPAWEQRHRNILLAGRTSNLVQSSEACVLLISHHAPADQTLMHLGESCLALRALTMGWNERLRPSA